MRLTHLTEDQIKRSYNLRNRLQAFPAPTVKKQEIINELVAELGISIASFNNKVSGRQSFLADEMEIMAGFFCVTMNQIYNPAFPLTKTKTQLKIQVL